MYRSKYKLLSVVSWCGLGDLLVSGGNIAQIRGTVLVIDGCESFFCIESNLTQIDSHCF